MIRIHRETIVPKYKTGCFSWDQNKEKIRFNSWVNEHSAIPEINTNGFVFKLTMDQAEEAIFIQEFQRNTISADSEVIVLEDIKNLVLFLAPKEILTKKFINVIHTENFDRFARALIMYFEYFLHLVEFVLVRRDEKTGDRAQIESFGSIKMKQIYAEYMMQYRIILAKEYSLILLGIGEMAKCYHLMPVINISMSILDMAFHESFLAFCTQMVWIAHHRKAYDVIDDEISRLFRSEHFKLQRSTKVQFEKFEKDLLYGKHDYRSNFRQQNSPVILELKHIERHNLPILWIGKKKYRGNNLRMQQLEMEVIIPESQLYMANITHGILGHPKKLYNTLLALDYHKLREMRISKSYDPYNLYTQPFLESHDLDILQKKFENYAPHFDIQTNPVEFNHELINKWKKRDRHINLVRKQELHMSVVAKCRREVETIGKEDRKLSARAIAKFLLLTKKLRKGV